MGTNVLGACITFLRRVYFGQARQRQKLIRHQVLRRLRQLSLLLQFNSKLRQFNKSGNNSCKHLGDLVLSWRYGTGS